MASKRKTPKTDSFVLLTSEERFALQKPHYNGFAVGHGAHGRKGYDRKRQKSELHRLLDE